MQTIKYSHEIVVFARKIFRLGHIECDPIRQASLHRCVAGGCNPIPLKSHIEGATLVIDEAALEGGHKVFRNGKGG